MANEDRPSVAWLTEAYGISPEPGEPEEDFRKRCRSLWVTLGSPIGGAGPFLGAAVASPPPRPSGLLIFRMWKAEAAACGAVLFAVALLSGGGWREFVGAAAVLLSFMHGQVAARHAEAERRRAESREDRRADVDCWKWGPRYFAAKEVFWAVYFAASRSWSALAGVAVFLLYPVWRRWYVRRKVRRIMAGR